MPTETIARWLIYAGVGLVVVGLLIWLLGRFLDLGTLPGDLAFRGENVRVYAPITTMIIVSIALTVLLNLVLRWLR